MKHFSDFLTHKTHASKQLGKIARTLVFDIKCKSLELKNLERNLQALEAEIGNKIAPLYNEYSDYTDDVIASVKKCHSWNNEPIAKHKPVKKTETQTTAENSAPTKL